MNFCLSSGQNLPNFCPFSWHKWNLMKFSWYLTIFPKSFNNISLKSFGLLQNLTRNYEILQKLMRFHETNESSQNFLDIILCFHWVEMYLAAFTFHDLKVDCKISVSFRMLWNFKVLNLAMVKVKKVNKYTVTYWKGLLAKNTNLSGPSNVKILYWAKVFVRASENWWLAKIPA